MKINGKSNPIGGIFIGIIFLIGGLVLLWWNEGRTVRQAKAIGEAEKTYIDVKSDEINSSNEGKLIATNGTITIDKELNDTQFGVIKDTAILKRIVEIYQWVENCSEDNNGNETCEYNKRWEEDLVDSSKFKESIDHSNPKTKKYSSNTFIANEVKAGTFVVPNDLVKKLSTKEYVKLDSSNDDMRYTESQLGLKIDSEGKYFTDVKGTEPDIGDIRVSFKYNDATALSMMGVQSGKTITPYTAKTGNKIFELYEGEHRGAEMIQFLKDENNTIKVVLRIVGVVVVIIGLLAIISPIQKLASYVPILGAIFNGATTLIAILFGLAISLIDIAIAWIVYRPILGITLLVAAVGLIVTGVVLKKKKATPVQAQQPVQQPVQPVVPEQPVQPAQPIEQQPTNNDQNQ